MNDFQAIINESKPTLVDFFATWCGPCRMQGPVLEEVKSKAGDKANVIKIDIDKNQELAIMCVPYRLLSYSKTAKPCGVP